MKEDLLEIIGSFVGPYKVGAVESVTRNRHMNDLSGNEKISQELVNAILTGFVDYTENHCPDNVDVKTVGKMVDILVNCIRDYRNSDSVGIDDPSNDKETLQRIIDAILVDFANYIAAMHCLDLALKTEDIKGNI